MSLFDKLYNASAEVVADAKKPLVQAKVKRGFDAAVDSLESQRLDLEEKIDKARGAIANGNVEEIKKLANLASELAEVDVQKAAITAEREAMFADK